MLTFKGVAQINPLPEFLEKSKFTYKGPYSPSERKYVDKEENLSRKFGTDMYYLPRGLFGYSSDIKTNLPRPQAPIEPKIKKSVIFTPNQKVVIKHLWNEYFRYPWGHTTLILPTGIGKTLVSLKVAIMRKTPILFIVPTRTLVRQTYDEIIRFIDNPGPISVWASGLGKKYSTPENHRSQENYFTIATKSSLVNKVRSDFEQFGMIIIDEVHKLCSVKETELYRLFSTRWMLGMTASPNERNDKRDPVYQLLIGPNMIAEDLVGYNRDEVKFNGKVIALMYQTPDEFRGGLVEIKGFPSVTRTVAERLLPDNHRNNLILQSARSLCAINDMCIFVFANRKDILIKLYHMAKKMECEEFKDITLITADSKEDELIKASETSNIIFAIDAIFNTGISIPKQKGIIWATPHRTGTKQSVGRITRRNGDPSQVRFVIDIVDTGIFVFWDQFETKKKDKPCRRNEYERRNFIIHKVVVEPGDSVSEKILKFI